MVLRKFHVLTCLVAITTQCIIETATKSCHNKNSTLSITVRADDWPSEIQWYLLDDKVNWTNFNISTYIYYHFPYDDIYQLSSHVLRNSSADYWHTECAAQTDDICISDGCYNLLIMDDYGDGICCNYGYGYYNVKLNSKMLTFADLQYYDETYSLIYFCTNMFDFKQGGKPTDLKAAKVKMFEFASKKRSKIVMENSNGKILYQSENFVPFGNPYKIPLNADNIYSIKIYQDSSNSWWYTSWKLIKTLKNGDIWDVVQFSRAQGLFSCYFA